MKKVLWFILIIFAAKAYSQNSGIRAGDSLNLYCPMYFPHPQFAGTWNIDMDSDLVNDFYFDLTYGNYPGYTHEESGLSTFPGCYILTDSLNTMPAILNYGDKIDSTCTWNSGQYYLCYYARYTNLSTYLSHDTSYGTWYGVVNKYIGIKMVKSSAVYYGWLNISPSAGLITINGWRSQNAPSSVNSLSLSENNFSILNRDNGDVILMNRNRNDGNQYKIDIINLTGQIINTSPMRGYEFVIPVNPDYHGTYLLRVSDNQGKIMFRGKFVN